ncbi:MAG TPA: hypothetical protein PLC94_11785, partial [bacterium]|nr:hypothetical protein [bacterium]
MAKKKSAPKKAAKKVVKKAVKKVAKAAPKKSTKKVAKKAAGVKKQKLTPDQLHAKVLGKVETYIKRIYGKSYEKHDDGRFLVFEGSTVVQTVLRPWHAGDIVVESFAYVVQ